MVLTFSSDIRQQFEEMFVYILETIIVAINGFELYFRIALSF